MLVKNKPNQLFVNFQPDQWFVKNQPRRVVGEFLTDRVVGKEFTGAGRKAPFTIRAKNSQHFFGLRFH
jgi:hypothetical protein